MEGRKEGKIVVVRFVSIRETVNTLVELAMRPAESKSLKFND